MGLQAPEDAKTTIVTIAGMKRNIQHWRSFNLSIFGRTVMINSCLVSKLWFKAHHLPISNKYLRQMNNIVHEYFRKGSKGCSVNLCKRITPRAKGGMGQLDIRSQSNNLLTCMKWVIMYTSGYPALWTHFWEQNVIRIQNHLQSVVDPTLCHTMRWGSMPKVRIDRTYSLLIPSK